MPAPKAHRVSQRKHGYNLPLRTRTKTFVTRARSSMNGASIEEAEKAVREAVVALDKAAQKGAIHKKNAGRRKARIMHQLHQMKAEQAAG